MNRKISGNNNKIGTEMKVTLSWSGTWTSNSTCLCCSFLPKAYNEDDWSNLGERNRQNRGWQDCVEPQRILGSILDIFLNLGHEDVPREANVPGGWTWLKSCPLQFVGKWQIYQQRPCVQSHYFQYVVILWDSSLCILILASGQIKVYKHFDINILTL